MPWNPGRSCEMSLKLRHLVGFLASTDLPDKREAGGSNPPGPMRPQPLPPPRPSCPSRTFLFCRVRPIPSVVPSVAPQGLHTPARGGAQRERPTESLLIQPRWQRDPPFALSSGFAMSGSLASSRSWAGNGMRGQVRCSPPAGGWRRSWRSGGEPSAILESSLRLEGVHLGAAPLAPRAGSVARAPPSPIPRLSLAWAPPAHRLARLARPVWFPASPPVS